MGYAIKKVLNKNGPQWKLQFVTYDKVTAINPNAKSPRKFKDIPKTDWASHGFHLTMTIDQAKVKAQSLNAIAEVKRWGETKTKIRERIDKDSILECAFLPRSFVIEFETEIVFEKICRASDNVKNKNKVLSHWRAAQKIIAELKMEPSDWEDKKHRFYNHFVKKQMSPSYVQKVLRLLNEWGLFLSKNNKKYFSPIPTPSNSEAQRIADAFYEKTPSGEGEASDPMSPSLLESKKGQLLEQHFNWLYISVWFGLRPHEIDGLVEPKNIKVTTNKSGRKLLHVYQPKLITVPKPQRWKVIPLKYKEQNKALELIEAKDFKRPSYKVVHKWFGDGITLYAGRKNFTDMMLENGEKFEEVSMWMGHRTLDRTYRDYKDRLKTSYENVG